MSCLLDWQPDALAAQLQPLLPGLSVEVLATSGSTNSLLIERARSDARPVLLVSESQSGGRGRMGRAWVAAPGCSLTFSLGLPLPTADWSGLSLAVGCVLAETLEPLGERLQLKWPNDLWLVSGPSPANTQVVPQGDVVALGSGPARDGRKLGGVLIESQAVGTDRYLVVGVGLNIQAIQGAGAEQFSSGFAALEELRPGITAPQALARIAPGLLRAVLDFGSEGFAPWQHRFDRRDLSKGRPVTAGSLRGIARGVSPTGELRVQSATGMHSIASGEVSLRMET